MCPMLTRSPSEPTATSVVPIDSSTGSASDIANSARRASRPACRNSAGRSVPLLWSTSANTRSATVEATSPAACPPIPSASTSRRALANAESSLLVRTVPRSVCTA